MSSVHVKSKRHRARPGQPGGTRETNRREQTQALAEAAMRQFLEQGIDAASIDDITRAADVAKGSFYRYFADKTALVRSMMAPARDALEAGFEACGHALEAARGREAAFRAYQDLGAVLAGLVFGQPDVVRLYLQENRAPPTGARAGVGELAALVSRHAVELTVKAQRKRILRPAHAAVSAFAVIGAAEQLLLAVLRGHEVGDPTEIPSALTALLLDGLRAPR